MRPALTDLTHSGGFTSRVARFASTGALADFMKGKRPHSNRSEFNDWQSLDDARRLTREGCPEAVTAAQALLDEIDAQGIQTYRPRWQADVAGALPDVPRYVAGAPECMLRPDRRQSESAPVKLYVDVCVSAALTKRQLAARGNALLALALKLSQFRPVELAVFADMGARASDKPKHAVIPVMDIPANPLDMQAASYAMASPGFLRQLVFAYGDTEGITGHWAWNAQPSYSGRVTEYEKRLNEALGVGEEDLVIYGGHIYNKLITQPVEWVTEQLQRYVEQA